MGIFTPDIYPELDDRRNTAPSPSLILCSIGSTVDREPGKRKVKPSKAALVDLAELDLGESSDDSDFNVDEAKLNDDDDISINSDPDAPDADDDDDDDEMGEEEESEEEVEMSVTEEKNLSLTELLEQAKKKQALEAEKVTDFTIPVFL